MPSPLFLRILRWLPNIVVLLAIAAVTIGPFSWIVLGLAIFGKVWNGFSRYLAGQAHSSAGFHVTVALLSIICSFVVSILHLFSIYRFH